jgi:uncharacterized protein (TIGR03435 family)
VQFLATTLALALAFVQTDTRPAYEVASVKLNTTGSKHTGTDGSPGQIVMTNQSIARLVQRAYGVTPPQVIGPDWLATVRVDVAAKYPAKASGVERVAMLRTLLEDRFKIAVHRETRQLNVYALVPAKSGFKLKAVTDCEQDTDHDGGSVQTLSARCTPLNLLAQLLSRYMDVVVQDKTGIDGAFDFELKWTSQDDKPGSKEPDTIPAIFEVLQDAMGLRLQPQKAQVEVVVVDHIERTPTEN